MANRTEPSLKEKAAKGLFWGGISNGIQQFLGVVIGVILLRTLTPDDYGMIGLLAIFIAIGNSLLESGFTVALTNRKHFDPDDYNSVFWFNLVVAILIYCILYLCTPAIAGFYRQPQLIPLARVLFLSLILNSLGVAPNVILFRELKVKEKAKIDIFSTCGGGIVGIVLALNGYGYWALALQTIIYATLSTSLRWYFSPWHPSFRFKSTPIKEMFGFSSKLLFSTIITQIHTNIFSVLLGKFYTKTEVGYFSQGIKWSGMGIQVLNGMISGITQPILVKVKDEPEREIKVLRKLLRFIAFISFPALFGLGFIAEEFILIINTEWAPCIPIIQLYCLWGAFSPLQTLYNQIIFTHGRSNFYFLITLIYAVAQILTAFLSLSKGIYWMAFAMICVSFLFLVIFQFYISGFISLKIKDVIKDISPFFFITLVTLGISYLLTFWIEILSLKLIGKITITVILYIGVMKISNSVIFQECLLYLRKKPTSIE